MLNKLVIPANTKFEEKNIITNGDVIIGPNSKVDYGIVGRRIIVCERSSIGGSIFGEEVRLDPMCSIGGDVVSEGDAVIGEFVNIEGKLTVYGDLEIGRNVRIKKGFEARGLITIQDPLNIIMFIFIYILILLRLGRLDEVSNLLEDENFESSLLVPGHSQIDLEKIDTSKNIEIIASRTLGNVRGRDVQIKDSQVYGSVRGSIILIEGSKVYGAVEGKKVYLVKGSEVHGHIKANEVFIEENCLVEENIIAKHGVWIKDKIELPLGGDNGVGQGEI